MVCWYFIPVCHHYLLLHLFTIIVFWYFLHPSAVIVCLFYTCLPSLFSGSLHPSAVIVCLFYTCLLSLFSGVLHLSTWLVCLAQIDPLEREAMVVKDMYELIEEYKVPTPPEDFAVYQVGTTPHTHTCIPV